MVRDTSYDSLEGDEPVGPVRLYDGKAVSRIRDSAHEDITGEQRHLNSLTSITPAATFPGYGDVCLLPLGLHLLAYLSFKPHAGLQSKPVMVFQKRPPWLPIATGCLTYAGHSSAN